jgi:hypothetical protein
MLVSISCLFYSTNIYPSLHGIKALYTVQCSTVQCTYTYNIFSALAWRAVIRDKIEQKYFPYVRNCYSYIASFTIHMIIKDIYIYMCT